MKGNAFILTSILLLSFSHVAYSENKIEYPDRAWKLEQDGEVLVSYDIDSLGKARNVKVLESHPAYLFDDSVKQQIYGWKFPANDPKKNLKLRLKFSKQ
ncbi:MAG: TonB family protein [Pantoea sp.]|uniref:TonB family protein n=1 Tax=Pantoea sp. TaxID=69393 RepID=UPI00257F723E|nr:TonB family protein [Pantoea sp.]MBS6032055.1 TonB family protein [Pantoea sp.]